ncbi:SHOCT domain-containing protein [Afipia sp. DC4300-2b1]|uniref:SHOCT domain-containing protein n=1 Tax=Afipia sp. DC4300-2b1 TaxID=2804672 RepID=UPI003CF2C22E
MSEVANIALEIEKLDELRARKVITDEEFADRKAKLLATTKPGNPPKQKRPGTTLAVSVIAVSLLAGAAYGYASGQHPRHDDYREALRQQRRPLTVGSPSNSREAIR